MDIKALAEQYNDYIIDRRRYYHTCPELSGEEKNTRAHLKEDLEALGITDIHELETCYGLTATIHGGKSGKRKNHSFLKAGIKFFHIIDTEEYKDVSDDIIAYINVHCAKGNPESCADKEDSYNYEY